MPFLSWSLENGANIYVHSNFRMLFLSRESTKRAVVVTLTSARALASHFKVLRQSFFKVSYLNNHWPKTFDIWDIMTS